MRAWIWLRTLAVIMALFAFGHTVGTLPVARRGPQEAALFAAMQDFRFPVMGFTRSYWEFYRGFSVTITAALLLLMVFAWQVGNISRHDSRAALPMAVTLLAGCVSLLALSWMFFFTGPLLSSALATAVAAGAVVALMTGKSPGEMA
jgi:hypothetical protein